MRYLPLTNDDRKNMKKVIGISDINEMFTNVPKEVSLDPKFNLPNHKTEMEVGKILSEIANKNINSNQVPFFLGAGAYKHHIPATVDHIIQRSEFLTSYTPINLRFLKALFSISLNFKPRSLLLQEWMFLTHLCMTVLPQQLKQYQWQKELLKEIK